MLSCCDFALFFLLGHIPVSSFCLNLCFSVLEKSAMSPVLESRGLMKKRSCNALHCSVPVQWNLVLQSVYSVCCMCPASVAESRFPLVKFSAVDLFACFWQFLVPVVSVWGCLGLELNQTRHFQDSVAPNCKALSLFCPLRNQTSCLPQVHFGDHSLTSICG